MEDKMKKQIFIAITLAFSIALGNGLFSQVPTKSGSESQAQGSYLDVYHSKQKAFQLKESNKSEIYRLKVIVANFGESPEKEKLKAALKNYKDAIKKLYTRNYLQSAKMLEENKDDLNEIYASMVKIYNEKVDKLLDQCADRLVDMELAEVVGPATQDSSKARMISKTRIRITVAYGQLGNAEAMEKDQKYAEAISHYRVAIYHGIEILRSLAKNSEDENKILKEYSVEIADSENKLGPGKSFD